MSKIFTILKNQFRRGKNQIILAAFAGILACLMFYLIGGMVQEIMVEGVPVGVLDHDNSELSADLNAYLDAELGMSVMTSGDYDTLATELIEKHIAAIIEIPEGFHDAAASGSPIALETTTLDDYENAVFLEIYLDSYMSSINTMSKGANGDAALFDELLRQYPEQRVAIQSESVVTLTQEQLSQRSGFINGVGFYVMLSSMLAMALSTMLYDDRKKGTYSRIRTANVLPAQYVVSSALFGFIIAMIQVVILFAFVGFSGFDIGMPIGVAFLLSSLYALFIVGFGMLVGLYIRSKNAISAAIIGFGTIGAMLGGAYFPVDVAPALLQQIAKLTPQYWIMNSIRGFVENGMTEYALNAVILLLFAVLCFILTGVKFARQKTAA